MEAINGWLPARNKGFAGVNRKDPFRQQYLMSLDGIAIAAGAISHPNCLGYLVWLHLPFRSDRISSSDAFAY